MEVHILHKKDEIFDFLKSEPELQTYCIGDLDDFFWPKTSWFGLIQNGVVKSIALLYIGSDLPTLLLFFKRDRYYAYQLLKQIKTLLPNKFYAHLSEGLVDVFGKENIVQYYGLSYKMALKNSLHLAENENVKRFSVNDVEQIQAFYSIAYPDNWFDSRMLETGKYFGYFDNSLLKGVAGIHVYSADYKVAALGNIAVHKDYRGRGVATKLTSHLCYDLKETVEAIGLNVKANNEYAIRSYQKIGFEIIGTYDECLIKNDIE